jgi:glycine dehydrogenase subunit 1
LAKNNVARAHDAHLRLVSKAKLEAVFSGPYFNEFVIRANNLEDIFTRCAAQKIVPGIKLGQWYTELQDCLLVCVTEMNEAEEIAQLVRTISRQ